MSFVTVKEALTMQLRQWVRGRRVSVGAGGGLGY